jgi:glycosyltransferase involved in cell wall biosynthesis
VLGADPSEPSLEAARVRRGDCVVLVAPLAPQSGGNGLAMRAGMLLEALAERWPVELVIVPLSGPPSPLEWASGLARAVTVIAPSSPSDAREHIGGQLADPLLRARLAASAPLWQPAAAAPPTLAKEALAAIGARAGRPRAVLVLRGYLAPLGATLARLLAAERLIIDLDDDDEGYARSLGADEEADAVARLARAWLPDADVVSAAAEREARTIAARYGLRAVVTVPNAVRLPRSPPTAPPGDGRLLFVGNLTYGPNIEAAHLLAEEILPLVRGRHPGAGVDLVGPHGGRLGASGAGVRVHGLVADLEPLYHSADVVLAPLRHGGGTRIKVLEAFAHARPVVATATGVAGLAVRDGHDVLLGDSAEDLAHAVCRLLEDGELRARIAEHAAQTLAGRYVQNVVAPLVCELVDGEPRNDLDLDPT